MAYSPEQIAQQLKSARKTKGLSQRALAKRVGIPQSHLSKIEGGSVDLRLSSLLEMARALELDVALVPRKHLSAVGTLIGTTHSTAQTTKAVHKALKTLNRRLATLTQQNSTLTVLAQLQRRARELEQMSLPSSSTATLREVDKTIRAFEENPSNIKLLGDSLHALDTLRSSLAQAGLTIEKRRQAYSLESDDRG